MEILQSASSLTMIVNESMEPAMWNVVFIYTVNIHTKYVKILFRCQQLQHADYENLYQTSDYKSNTWQI